MNGLSSTELVKKAKSTQREDNKGISGHTEDILPALFREAQEAHISAMHVELASSLAGDVDISSWASEASRAPIDSENTQLEGKKEQGCEEVSQNLGIPIPETLQQMTTPDNSKEGFENIVEPVAGGTSAVRSSLPCASPLAVTPDTRLQATAIYVPCTEAGYGSMPAPDL